MDKQPKLHFKQVMTLMQVEKFLSTCAKVYIFLDLCVYVPLAYFNCTPFINVRTLLINSIIIATIYVVRFTLLMIRIHLAKLDIANMKSLDLEIQDVLKVIESQAEENNEEKGKEENE